MDAEILTPESEHSVLAACIPASLAGARVFTATASQGLLLMHEVLHYASGARAPIVMANVNRTVASPWAFWPDQTDSLAQRDTGWIQFYSESPQESLDTVLQAFRIAEQVGLPAMVNHDAFYVSHSLEPVRCRPRRRWTATCRPMRRPSGWTRRSARPGATWSARRCTAATGRPIEEAMEQALRRRAGSRPRMGRADRPQLRPAGTLPLRRRAIVVVALGSMCGTAREAVDALRTEGIAAGLLKLRLLRPLPREALRVALAGVPHVLVLDRDHSPGLGGILHRNPRGAVWPATAAPRCTACWPAWAA